MSTRKSRARQQAETTEPILNRIEQLFMHPLLRHVLCQPDNTFDLKALMDGNGILLVNLASGTVGEEATFLGSMLISYLYSNALRRDPMSTPPPFTCYIDEFADLATTAFSRTLSTCRKFGLRFVIAHQYLDQLPRDIRASIFGNIGTTLFFQVGSTDAALLEREGYFDPSYRHHRSPAALPFGTMHAVILQDGSNAMLQVKTDPPPAPRHSLAAVIKEHSRSAYAMPSADIEAYIRELVRRHRRLTPHPHQRIKLRYTKCIHMVHSRRRPHPYPKESAMETIDDAKIIELVRQGLSQRAIADQLKIPRSTLRRHLEKQKGVPEETYGTPYWASEGVPEVHQGFPSAADLAQSWGEVQEVLDWWRERKQSLARTLDETRKRRRQTYHVEERYIEAIRRAADLERTDLAEIVNRAFARYFVEQQRTT